METRKIVKVKFKNNQFLVDNKLVDTVPTTIKAILMSKGPNSTMLTFEENLIKP